MTLRDAFVCLEMVAMIVLAVYFWKDGLHRLAAAQVCYTVATAVLFVGV